MPFTYINNLATEVTPERSNRVSNCINRLLSFPVTEIRHNALSNMVVCVRTVTIAELNALPDNAATDLLDAYLLAVASTKQ